MNQFSQEKILHHLDRVVEWQQSGASRPITYELDLTNICNSRCSFCFGFSGAVSDKSFMTLVEAKNIIKQISDMGGKGLNFTGGGEPLCSSSTIEAVRYAKKCKLDVGFITNGILITPENAQILVDCCTWIRVSLDAGSRETYEITHGLNSNTFDQVKNNIALLVRCKKSSGSKVTIGTGFITFPAVKGDMIKFVKLSKKLKVDYAQFRPLLKKFEQKEINMVPDKNILKIIDRCKTLASPGFSVVSSLHKYNAMRNDSVNRNYSVCNGHHFAAVIAADRKMYLCCHMRGMKKYCIGDLATHTLSQIWKSSRRRQVYKQIDFSDCPLLCRCDGFNKILWHMEKKQDHINFL